MAETVRTGARSSTGLTIFEVGGAERQPVPLLEVAHEAQRVLDLGATAVVLRGAAKSLEAFCLVRDIFLPEKTPYVEAATPRTALGDDVFTSTDYPAAERIFFHNENSSAQTWPGRLVFGCLQAADEGGATQVSDVRTVLRQLDPETLERFLAKGWMLVRNYRPGFGIDWRTAFGTESRDDVAAYCMESEVDCSWLADDHLRTVQRREAFARHPGTGEIVWFNHVVFWHPSRLQPDVREMFFEEFGSYGLPFETRYGDGSLIPDEVVAEIADAYEAGSLQLKWQCGDVLVIDNMRMAHGREPFKGPRRVVVSMGAPLARTACWANPADVRAQAGVGP